MRACSFRAVEELQNNYNRKLGELADKALEDFANETMEEELEPHLEAVRWTAACYSARACALTGWRAQLLRDRDPLKAAVSTSHEIHIGKLLQKVCAHFCGACAEQSHPCLCMQESEMRDAVVKAFADIVATIRTEEQARNRSRVYEVRQLIERVEAEVLNFLREEQVLEEDAQ